MGFATHWTAAARGILVLRVPCFDGEVRISRNPLQSKEVGLGLLCFAKGFRALTESLICLEISFFYKEFCLLQSFYSLTEGKNSIR